MSPASRPEEAAISLDQESTGEQRKRGFATRDPLLAGVVAWAVLYVLVTLWFTRTGSALTPDSIDYAEAARSLSRGEGTTINRVMFHTGLFERIRHPLEVHGLLQPFLIAPLFLWWGPDPSLVRIPSVTFDGCLIVAAFVVGRKQFGWLSGLVAACLVYARQDFLFWSVVGGDDVALAVFSALALSFFMFGVRERKLSRFALAGFLAALAWLAKASGVAVVVAFALGLLFNRTARQNVLFRFLVAAALPSVVAFGLYVLRNLQVYGRTGSPYTAIEWLGRDDFPAYFALYERIPSIGDFVSRFGVAHVVRAILHQLVLMLQITLTDPLLLAVVPAMVVLRRRNGAFASFTLAYLIAVLLLVCVAHHVEYRYLSALIVLGAVGIGGLLEEIESWTRARFIGARVTFRTVVLILVGCYASIASVLRCRDLLALHRVMQKPDDCADASNWMSANVPREDVVLTANAWFVSWGTERAAVGAPTNGDEAVLTVAGHYGARWAMTGKPVVGAIDLDAALASPRIASVLRPKRVFDGQACDVYRLAQ